MHEFLAITNALADESRVRALLALGRGELCACQITALLDLAPSTVSKHLSLLKTAGLVDARKQGRWIHYRLADHPTPAARAALRFLHAGLADAAFAADTRRLSDILAIDPEILCDQINSKCCSSAPATPAARRWPKASPARSAAT